MTDEERERYLAELREINANTSKLMLESQKFGMEREKLRLENQWYPFVIGAGVAAGLMTAGAALFSLLVKYLV